MSNPVAQLDLQNEKQRFLKLQGAFNLDYEIFQDLTFTSRISIETNYNRFYNFENKLAYYLSVEPNNTIENFQPTDPDAPELPVILVHQDPVSYTHLTLPTKRIV